MIDLTFVEHNGEHHHVSAKQGANLMQVAVDNAIPGIDADCGGSCACGTCHIRISQQWLDKVGAASESEALMLEMTPEHDVRSRLACQVTIQPEMSGMIVEIPEFQM